MKTFGRGITVNAIALGYIATDMTNTTVDNAKGTAFEPSQPYPCGWAAM
ncbi:hypothetical protein HQ531_08480 [bacterium]|nr:hypothetical protein [bacterium]